MPGAGPSSGLPLVLAGPAQEGHQPLGGRRVAGGGHLRPEQAVVAAVPQAGHDLVRDGLGCRARWPAPNWTCC